MLFLVPRICSTRNDDPSENISETIDHFRELEAYVLLGDPGAGKSSLLRTEAANTEHGYFVTARDFIDYDREEWRGKTLFIDGLDETRAGKEDTHTPLGAIRGKLDRLGRPRFRVSCRAADWLGNNDAEALLSCTPGGKVSVLHLEPLSHEQIIEILEHDARVHDADDFLNKASKFNLEGLLSNPQTLDMLISAVDGEEWPTTKLDVYKLACKKLAIDHRVQQQPYSTIQLLEAAGLLSAMQLLANEPAVHTDNDTIQGQIGLNDLDVPDRKPYQAVLKSRLFTYVRGGEYTYMHRSVAEYLGASFIADRIKEGLPFSRVLALATGTDGGVIAALRGLMAWLGALHSQARDWLIKVDPLGMVLYGDAHLFSTETKIKLLDALKQESEKSGYLNYGWNTHAFASLTTQDMVPHLLSLLRDPSRNSPDQTILGCILDGLYRSPSIPELDIALIAVIRDSSYWEGIRASALQAFMHQYPDDTESMLSLANDIHLKKVEDQDHRLLGLLLHRLFPDHIPASQILQYLVADEKEHSFNRYDTFWDTELPGLIRDKDLPVVLDALSLIGIHYPRRQSTHWAVSHMAEQLLVRGVLAHGTLIDNERLYRWLSIGIDEYDHSHLNNEYRQQLQDWIGKYPDRYLALLKLGISQINDPEKIHYGIYQASNRLYHADEPGNLGLWWLDQALDAKNIELGREYFRQAFWALERGKGHQGLSLDLFEQWVADHPEFSETYLGIIVRQVDETHIEHLRLQKKWKMEGAQELNARLDYFNQHKAAIADGTAYPQVFHHLALAWFDHYSGTNGKTGEDRLSELLNHDEGLIAAAKFGLSQILERPDLPQVTEIIDLAVKQREHYIRLPFLTCMEKLYQEDPSMLVGLSDDQASKALVFWYTYGAGNEPAWIRPLTLSRPRLAAAMMIQYVSAMLTGKVQHITGLYQLAHDSDYRQIASQVVLPLLEMYPIRSTKQPASNLEYLLKAAIAHADHADLLALVNRMTSQKRLKVTQQVYWLATGLILAPETYEPIIRKQIQGKTVRINHLSTFMYSGMGSKDVKYPQPAQVMGLLIELLGPRCKPAWETGGGIVTRAMNERDYVNGLLNSLGNMPDKDSGCELERLLLLPKLSTWHKAIRSARQTQRISHREATFRHPDANQVLQTLSNRKPANVADLAALAMDFLNTLSIEMHASNTDSYKHCWNVDGYGKPTHPKPENDCRNYLAERLRALFARFDVDVQPETREAESKRADMRLSFHRNGKSSHLPIEVKLSHSPDLWIAIHEQLIPLYTIAPETEGRGILLVFWFNDQEKRMPAPPNGIKPVTANELALKLQDTLSPQEQKLIDIFVLDVSKPHKETIGSM